MRCGHPDCTLPDLGRCARASEFADPLLECPEIHRAEPGALAQTPVLAFTPTIQLSDLEESDDAAPWKGRHLGLVEAEAIAQRSPARVISVLGPFNAGKTSLMASFFLQIANGQYGTFPYRFASSRTLYGFQDLVNRATRWSGKSSEQIVEHTPKEDAADGGRFLHVGLRPRASADDRHIDVLLSDVAGEWIEGWSKLVDEDSRRRLAFIPRSDGFIVVADAPALLGTSGRKMDSDLGRLIRRITAARGPRSARPGLALVFSKFDCVLDRVTLPDEASRANREGWGALGRASGKIWAALDHARETGFEVAVFPVSAFPRRLAAGQPVGVMAPFTHVMKCADRRDRWPTLPVMVPEGASYFQAMRRWETES
jgi:hypothetical protein